MYTEFLAATIEACGRIEEDRLAEAFDRLDCDDTGYSKWEPAFLFGRFLYRFFSHIEMPQRCSSFRIPVSEENLRELIGTKSSDEDIKAIILVRHSSVLLLSPFFLQPYIVSTCDWQLICYSVSLTLFRVGVGQGPRWQNIVLRFFTRVSWKHNAPWSTRSLNFIIYISAGLIERIDMHIYILYIRTIGGTVIVKRLYFFNKKIE